MKKIACSALGIVVALCITVGVIWGVQSWLASDAAAREQEKQEIFQAVFHHKLPTTPAERTAIEDDVLNTLFSVRTRFDELSIALDVDNRLLRKYAESREAVTRTAANRFIKISQRRDVAAKEYRRTRRQFEKLCNSAFDAGFDTLALAVRCDPPLTDMGSFL